MIIKTYFSTVNKHCQKGSNVSEKLRIQNITQIKAAGHKTVH